MRKSEIVRSVAEATALTQVKAEEAVDAILEEIKSTLSQGEEVIVRRFGTFSVRAKAARAGRNPKTGEPSEISARSVVRFKAGSEFKAAVQGLCGVSDEERDADENRFNPPSRSCSAVWATLKDGHFKRAFQPRADTGQPVMWVASCEPRASRKALGARRRTPCGSCRIDLSRNDEPDTL